MKLNDKIARARAALARAEEAERKADARSKACWPDTQEWHRAQGPCERAEARVKRAKAALEALLSAARGDLVPDLCAALDRLARAAECREYTMGDPCRLIEVKAELEAAAKAARAILAKVRRDGAEEVEKTQVPQADRR